MKPDNLAPLKDDMVAYITALGLQRFSGFVDSEKLRAVLWAAPHEVSPVAGDRPEDGWKEFLELAKAAGISFVTMFEMVLAKDELEEIIDALEEAPEAEESDRAEMRGLRRHVGKIGSLQLGFSYQGTLFLYETTTEWYESFRMMQETIDRITDLILDAADDDDLDEV